MRIIKTILLSVIALSLIVSTCIFILFQTFDTDQYLSHILKKASFAIGRSVSIGHAGLGLSSQGITLDTGPVIIADDADFTSQPFVQIDRVRIKVDLWALIFRREFHITDILLESPQLHFIRLQDGRMNIQSLVELKDRHPDDLLRHPERSEGSQDILKVIHEQRHIIPGVAVNEANHSFDLINSIRIKDASISLIDQNQSVPLDGWLLNINAKINDFSLTKPFTLSFDAAPLVLKGIAKDQEDRPILKDIQGQAGYDLALGIISNGDIIMTGGVVKDFNIFKELLSHTLGDFGGIEDQITKLGGNDTLIEKAEAKFTYQDKVLSVHDLLIRSNVLELTAQGSLDQGFNMDMQTMFHLNQDISAALINDFDSLRFFCDDSKRITIGGSLKGVLPHLKFKPNKDFKKKSKKALIAEGGNMLNFLLR